MRKGERYQSLQEVERGQERLTDDSQSLATFFSFVDFLKFRDPVRFEFWSGCLLK